MSESSTLLKGVWARRLRDNGKKTGEMIVAAFGRYQTWILLILAVNAATTIGSVLSHDFPGKTIFGLVWLVAFGAALISVILSSELGGTTPRPVPVDRGRPLRSATRFG
jgi:hypothetical protein